MKNYSVVVIFRQTLLRAFNGNQSFHSYFAPDFTRDSDAKHSTQRVETTFLLPERVSWCIPQEGQIGQAYSVKMAKCFSHSFSVSLWTTTPDSIKMQKTELDQYPAILTSRLVHNPYVFIAQKLIGLKKKSP